MIPGFNLPSGLLSVAVCAAILTASSSAQALPLTEAACERYANERAMLLRLGVREHLGKGPEWARENLTPPELDLIQRYIKLQEALEFRCPDTFARAEVRARKPPRRLNVIPPAPVRKPETAKTKDGVSKSEVPPVPVKGPSDQG